MNVLEVRITEIHSEKPAPPLEWTDGEYIIVDISTICWGSEDRSQRILPVSTWEEDKERGFYYA